MTDPAMADSNTLPRLLITGANRPLPFWKKQHNIKRVAIAISSSSIRDEFQRRDHQDTNRVVNIENNHSQLLLYRTSVMTVYMCTQRKYDTTVERKSRIKIRW